MMDLPIQLIVKVQQFEDKRIEARASWNIKELKGKLSEIYPTSTEEQKLIYSGKLLNDTVVLKDVLREYEGQEAHTVHLVFTPKSGRNQKYESQSSRQSTSVSSSTNQSSTEMSSSELRQRHTSTVTPATTNTPSPEPQTTQQQQQQANVMNIPSNYLNSFYGSGDANNIILAQQYAMQSWMQQAYAQYMNQYMSLLSSPEAFYQMNQQQQTQQPPNFAFLPPQMPFVSPTPAVQTLPNDAPAQPPQNNDAQVVAGAAQPQQPQPAPEAQQRRFPNIIQDEQENRDWLDILYSMSRLMILLCLVYFYSSPIRCLVVILIGISIYWYHIYKQNQARMNNNNPSRVNLNVNRPPAAPAPQAAGENQNQENAERDETEGAANESNSGSASEPLVASAEPTAPAEPQVPLLTIVRTFVLSFFTSIIPEAPAL